MQFRKQFLNYARKIARKVASKSTMLDFYCMDFFCLQLSRQVPQFFLFAASIKYLFSSSIHKFLSLNKLNNII